MLIKGKKSDTASYLLPSRKKTAERLRIYGKIFYRSINNLQRNGWKSTKQVIDDIAVACNWTWLDNGRERRFIYNYITN